MLHNSTAAPPHCHGRRRSAPSQPHLLQQAQDLRWLHVEHLQWTQQSGHRTLSCSLVLRLHRTQSYSRGGRFTRKRIRLAPPPLALVMRPCMMRKCGLFTLSCTEWNSCCTRLHRIRRRNPHGASANGSHIWPAGILPLAQLPAPNHTAPAPPVQPLCRCCPAIYPSTHEGSATLPLMRYLERPPMTS